MGINPLIMKELQRNNNTITTSQIVKLGFSRALLSKYVKEGLLERRRQGVYILPNSVHADMYTLMLRSGKIIFPHDTALFLNGLSERTPFEHSVTVPSNVVLSATLREDCNCYYIKPELFELGMTWKKTTFNNKDLNRLAVYAEKFRGSKILKRYMEVLL